MKKSILLITGLILCTLISTAQQGFDLGVAGSFNSAWILKQNNYGTLDPFASPEVRQSEMAYKYTWGGSAGVCLGYIFTKHWGLQSGLQYTITGQNYNDNFDGPAYIGSDTIGSVASRVNVQRVVKLSYLQIPLLVKFMAGKDKAKFFACLGPQIGIRTSAYQQVKIAGNVYTPDSLNFTAAQRFQTVDFGFVVQAGVQLYATPHLYFDLGLTAYEGVTDINGTVLKDLGWYDKNHLSYQKSYNFSGGILLGIHYVFSREAGKVLEITKPESK
jgi:hypothetical protein